MNLSNRVLYPRKGWFRRLNAMMRTYQGEFKLCWYVEHRDKHISSLWWAKTKGCYRTYVCFGSDIFILDEPTTGMDGNQNEFYELMHQCPPSIVELFDDYTRS